MNWTFWKWAKPCSRSSTGSEGYVSEATLERLEDSIAKLRAVPPKDRAVALDGLAFVAGSVMDDAANEWERLIGRTWERYVD